MTGTICLWSLPGSDILSIEKNGIEGIEGIDGVMEEWNNGKMEDWNNGRLEECDSLNHLTT